MQNTTTLPSRFAIHPPLHREGFWVREFQGFSPFRVEKLAAKQTDEGVSSGGLPGSSAPTTPHPSPVGDTFPIKGKAFGCLHFMAPLCKGSCHACVTEGLFFRRAAEVVSPYDTSSVTCR